MHFAALCFHFPSLCLPESRARHTRPSQGEGRAARENKEKDKWGRKEEKTISQTSEQDNTKKAFVCNKRSNLPYPSWWRRRGEAQKEKRLSGKNKKQEGEGSERHWVHSRKAGKKRNQWEGRREEGNSDTHTEWVRETWVKPDDSKAAHSSRMRASWTATHLLYRQQRCSPITLWRDRRGWERKSEWERERRESELPCAPLEPCLLGEEETNRSGALALPEEKSWPGRRRGGKRGVREGRGGHTAQGRVRDKRKGESECVCNRKCEWATEREETQRKGKAFVSRLERGRKEEGKKNTMSTVKRPRGRVSELCWELGGRRDKGEEEGPAGTEQPPLLLAHAALPPSWTHCCFFPLSLYIHLLCRAGP